MITGAVVVPIRARNGAFDRADAPTVLALRSAAAKTQSFLGERYRRLVKRMPKSKAMVAIARSILTVIWHLLNDPASRYQDLGVDFHTRRIDTARKTPRPHPPTPSPRLHRHPRTRRLTYGSSRSGKADAPPDAAVSHAARTIG